MLKLGHLPKTAGTVVNWFDEQNRMRSLVKRSKSSGSDDRALPDKSSISSVSAKSYSAVGKVVKPQDRVSSVLPCSLPACSCARVESTNIVN